MGLLRLAGGGKGGDEVVEEGGWENCREGLMTIYEVQARKTVRITTYIGTKLSSRKRMQ